jgi:hypothetical protein
MRPRLLARRRIHQLPVPSVNYLRRYHSAVVQLSHYPPSCSILPQPSRRRHRLFVDVAGNGDSRGAASDFDIGKRFGTNAFGIDRDQRGVPTPDRAPNVEGETSGGGEQLLPRGVVRQSDFFGETITFVDDADGFSPRSGPIRAQIDDDRSTGRGGGDGDRSADVSSRTEERSARRDGGDGISDAMSSFDGTSLCILSRGSANLHPGNDSDGPDARAYHAASSAWSEVLRHAWDWNREGACRDDRAGGGGAGRARSVTTAPMLAVAAAAPALAQGGVHYVRRIDNLLSSTAGDPSSGTTAEAPLSLLTMARNAASFRDAILLPPAAFGGGNSHIIIDPLAPSEQTTPQHLLTPRERWHLHALHQLLHNNHRDAMGAYLRLLELYPGDLLGLSLALDVAYALGDSNAALR